MNVVIRVELVESFKNLREGMGLTAQKLKSHPLLMHLLGVEIPPEGVTKLVLSPEELASLITTLDKLSMLIDGEEERKAIRNALALGCDAGKGIGDRRKRITTPSGPNESAEIQLGPRQVNRIEDDGFEMLADIVMKQSSSSLVKESDASVELAKESPASEADEELANEGKSKEFLRSLVYRYSDWATIGSDACLAVLMALSLILGALIMKGISPDKNDLINDALKERYAKLDPKPLQKSSNFVLDKVSVAVSGQANADESQGWGPKRRTFTMTKPAPYPVLNSITDHDRHGDERNFVQCRDRENSTWGTEVQAYEGHIYQCYIWFDNAVAPNLDDENTAVKLHDVRVRVHLPANEADNPSLVGILSAANSMTVWSSCVFVSEQPATIEYERGSASVHMLPYDKTSGPPQLAATYKGDTMVSGIAASSGALLGDGKLDGLIGQNAGYVLFDVKVKLG